jgi:hypothetical protein
LEQTRVPVITSGTPEANGPASQGAVVPPGLRSEERAMREGGTLGRV